MSGCGLKTLTDLKVLYDSDDDEGEEEEIGSAPARQQLRADNEDDAGVIEIELHRV